MEGERGVGVGVAGGFGVLVRGVWVIGGERGEGMGDAGGFGAGVGTDGVELGGGRGGVLKLNGWGGGWWCVCAVMKSGLVSNPGAFYHDTDEGIRRTDDGERTYKG